MRCEMIRSYLCFFLRSSVSDEAREHQDISFLRSEARDCRRHIGISSVISVGAGFFAVAAYKRHDPGSFALWTTLSTISGIWVLLNGCHLGNITSRFIQTLYPPPPPVRPEEMN